MKKIIKTEDCDKEYLSDRKRRALILLCDAILILSASAYTGLAVKERYEEKIQEYQQKIEKLQQEKEKAPLKITQIDAGGALIQVTDPAIVEENGVVRVEAPEGFRMMNGVCYRVVYREGMHKSFEEIMDENTEAPEGSIVANGYFVELIQPTVEIVGGIKKYSLPEGYKLVGKYGVKVLEESKPHKMGR